MGSKVRGEAQNVPWIATASGVLFLGGFAFFAAGSPIKLAVIDYMPITSPYFTSTPLLLTLYTVPAAPVPVLSQVA